MNIGVTALVLPRTWELDETLAEVKRAGYRALELALRDDGYFRLGSSDTDLKGIVSAARDAGVDLVGICPNFSGRPRDIMTADVSARNAGIDSFMECIRIAEVMGIETILVVTGRLTPDLYYDVAYRNALGSMKELARAAETAGVNLAIEYVWNKFLLSPLEFARFCDEVGSSSVGFYFDPGNMTIFGYAEHWARICGRHLMAAHMKDFKRQGSEWTPLLKGDVDFAAVMKELRDLGFDGALVSEVDPAVAPLAETARTIRTIMEM